MEIGMIKMVENYKMYIMENKLRKIILLLLCVFCVSYCFSQNTVRRNKAKDTSHKAQVIRKSNDKNNVVTNNAGANRNNHSPQQLIKFRVTIDNSTHEISMIDGNPNDLRRYTLEIGLYSNFDNAKGCAQRFCGFLIYDHTEDLYGICVGNTDNLSELENIKNYFSSQHYMTGKIICKNGY